MKKIVLIGPLPPPTGGVSIHLYRLWHLLKDDFEIDFIDESKNEKLEYFNLRKGKFFEYIKILNKSDIVAIHSGTNLLRIGHITISKLLQKKVVLVLHAYPERKNFILHFIHKIFFNLSDTIISVNANILQNISLKSNKIIIQQAFLPPILEQEPLLTEKLETLLEKAKFSGKTIISSNAWRLDRFNNQDLYGVDMCLEIAIRLKKLGKNICFVFNVVTIDKFQNDFNTYQNKIITEGLEDSFYLLNERISFVRLILRSDLIVRPTNTDGDSLSIRESIFFNKPVITSDVIARPVGSILFKNRDIDDFELKINIEINKLKANKEIKKYEKDDSYYIFYKTLFKNISNS